MYVVKRPFKNYGCLLAAGSIISDPAAIRRFKVKLTDGKIVEVTEANKQFYADYFQHKFGVDILQETKVSEDEQETAPVVAEAPKRPAKAIKVVAATAKK